MAGGALELANGFKVRLLRQKAPLLNKLTCVLFTNQPTITGTSVAADFVQSFLTRDTAKPTAPWGNASQEPDGRAVIRSALMSWDKLLYQPPDLVRGYWMRDENGFFAFGAYFPNTVQFGILNPARPVFIFRAQLFEDSMR
jgi:hypothetical protein